MWGTVGLIVAAVLLVVLLLKSISIIVKLLILIIAAGVMYFAYQTYPTQTVVAGVVLAAGYILLGIGKRKLKKKK